MQSGDVIVMKNLHYYISSMSSSLVIHDGRGNFDRGFSVLSDHSEFKKSIVKYIISKHLKSTVPKFTLPCDLVLIFHFRLGIFSAVENIIKNQLNTNEGPSEISTESHEVIESHEVSESHEITISETQEPFPTISKLLVNILIIF